MRGPYGAHTGIARGTRGVLRIIQPNRKYADAASRTGLAVWCDHGNSTDFTRPYGQEIVRVIKLERGPWLDVTEAL